MIDGAGKIILGGHFTDNLLIDATLHPGVSADRTIFLVKLEP